MVDVNEAVIARLKKAGEVFEVLVDCDNALAFQQGDDIPLEDILATRDIYTNVKKGEHAPTTHFKRVFHTEDVTEIVTVILKEGEVQVTAEHKAKLREEKRKQVVFAIHRNAINAKTGHPIPIDMIETVMREAKVRVDEFKSATAQVDAIIKAMRPFIPIKVESREIEVVIPSSFTGQAFSELRKFGKVVKEEWLPDGSLQSVIMMPAGLQEQLEVMLNRLTKGSYSLKVLKKI